MAVPTSRTDLSATIGSNSPLGSETISSGTGPDEYLRAHAAFIRQNYDDIKSSIVSVKDYGAVGNGSTDDTAAIQSAIDNVAEGTRIYFPAGTYLVASTVNIDRKVVLVGGIAGQGSVSTVTGSIIKGSGITIVLASATFSMENIGISDPTGHASTIGLKIDNGTDGVANWSLTNVFITGTASRLGTGLSCVFALKGTLNNCVIEGWNVGINFANSGAYYSNANLVSGCKIRYNVTGLTTNADTAFVSGCTIEANSTGISLTLGKLTVQSSHFENNQSPQINIAVSDGILYSAGNAFFSGATNCDIKITAGAQIHTSVGDTINAGITHNGTGLFLFLNPVIGVASSTGTGTAYILGPNSWSSALNGTSRALVLTGFAYILSDLEIRNSSGAAAIGGSGGTSFIDAGGSIKAAIGTLGQVRPQNTTTAIYSGAGSPEASIAANPGSIYLRTDGGTSTSFYVKETGSNSNTGWVAK